MLSYFIYISRAEKNNLIQIWENILLLASKSRPVKTGFRQVPRLAGFTTRIPQSGASTRRGRLQKSLHSQSYGLQSRFIALGSSGFIGELFFKL